MAKESTRTTRTKHSRRMTCRCTVDARAARGEGTHRWRAWTTEADGSDNGEIAPRLRATRGLVRDVTRHCWNHRRNRVRAAAAVTMATARRRRRRRPWWWWQQRWRWLHRASLPGVRILIFITHYTRQTKGYYVNVIRAGRLQPPFVQVARNRFRGQM